MKNPSEERINTGFVLLASVLLGLINILFLEELFQTVLSFISGLENIKINFYDFYLKSVFDFPSEFPAVLKIIILASPVAIDCILIETGLVLIRRLSFGELRQTIFFTILILIGYVLVYIFYSGFSVILNFNKVNDFVRLADELFTDKNSKIVFIIFVIVIFTAYLNSAIKRIVKHINGLGRKDGFS